MGDGRADGDADPRAATSPSSTISCDDWLGATGDTAAFVRPPGSTVGQYIILHQIGAGGMGVVYAAYDPKLDRKIALKVLRGDSGDESSAVARMRLLAEGRALARVSHPNVVTVFDVGSVEDEVYVAMELVDGQTLGHWRDEAVRTWQESVEKFVELAAGLIAVHDAELVHRDVKPDNVLIDSRGRARVTDFGLARPEAYATHSLEREERQLISKEDDDGASSLNLTRTGARLGTPAYMSSEQLQGREATPKSDQFAFCVALWECLYGERPFAGSGWMSLVLSVSGGEIREPPQPPGGRPIPGWLRRAVQRGLAPAPDDRWPSMADLRAALLAGDPGRARRRTLTAVALTAVTLSAVGGVYLHRAARDAEARAGCETQAHALEPLWGPERRAEIRGRFTSTQVDGAEDIAAGVVETLDDFAAQWADERRQVCVARLQPAASPADADLLARRTDCLERRRYALEAMLATFAEADDVVVKRSRRTAEGLADIDSCQDEQRLRNQPPLPEDPALRERARELRRALAQTLVHEHVGHYDEGLARSQTALKEALDLEFRPLIARARYRVAVFLEKRGEYKAAVESWAGSFRDATLCGDEMLAAEAASALAFTEGYQLSSHDAGIRWAELAGIHLERLGMTQTLTEATRLEVLAVLREMKGDYDTSLQTHHAALALRRDLVPPTHHSIGYGLANLAGVLQAMGRHEEAANSLLEAKDIFEAAFGPDNPTTAHVLNNLANLYARQGDYARAEPLLTRVQTIWTSSLGPDHPDVADVHNAFGELRRAQGRLDEAAALHERALATHERAHDGDHPDIAGSAIKLGQVQFLRGFPDQASAQFERALAVLRGREDQHLAQWGRARHGLGLVALHDRQHERARVYFERARMDFESDASEHRSWLARSRLGIAAAEVVAGRNQEVSAVFSDVADDTAVGSAVRAEAFAWQARAHAALGDPARSRAARARALALLMDATPDVRTGLAWVLDG